MYTQRVGQLMIYPIHPTTPHFTKLLFKKIGTVLYYTPGSWHYAGTNTTKNKGN